MLRGSCLCGSARFEIAGPLTNPLNCHCSNCRKAQGSAFRSRAGVNAADFRWLQGEKLVTYFESSPGVRRGFCRVCGSPLISRHEGNPSAFGLALGVFDGDPGVKPRANIFVTEKAPWFDITDALPQFPGFPK